MMDSNRKQEQKSNIYNYILVIIFGLICLIFGLILWNDSRFSDATKFYGCGLIIIILGIFYLLRLSRANMLKQSKELNTKRIKFYDEILKDDSNDIKVLNEKGATLIELERYKDAVECFNRALEIEPNNLEATARKRFVLEKLKNYENAEK